MCVCEGAAIMCHFPPNLFHPDLITDMYCQLTNLVTWSSSTGHGIEQWSFVGQATFDLLLDLYR